jgi:hypothetical protein
MAGRARALETRDAHTQLRQGVVEAVSLPRGERGKALLAVVAGTRAKRRDANLWRAYSAHTGRPVLTAPGVSDFLAEWVGSHKSGGLPSVVSALKREGGRQGKTMRAGDAAAVDEVVHALRVTLPTTTAKAAVVSSAMWTRMWDAVAPLALPMGADRRSFMGLASLARMFMMRATALLGKNLRPSDVTVRAHDGVHTITIRRFLGKASKTLARPHVVTLTDTSPGARVSRLILQLREEAIGRGGLEAAMFVRGNDDKRAHPGSPWSRQSITAVLQAILSGMDVSDTKSYTTKSLKMGGVTEAHAGGASDADIRAAGAWRSAAWGAYVGSDDGSDEDDSE